MAVQALLAGSPEGCWTLAGDTIPGIHPTMISRPGGALEMNRPNKNLCFIRVHLWLNSASQKSNPLQLNSKPLQSSKGPLPPGYFQLRPWCPSYLGGEKSNKPKTSLCQTRSAYANLCQVPLPPGVVQSYSKSIEAIQRIFRKKGF